MSGRDRLQKMRKGWKSCAAIVLATTLMTPAVFAQDSEAAPTTLPALDPTAPVVATDTDAAWYDDFTLSLDRPAHPVLDDELSFDWQLPGRGWGLTFGMDDNADPRLNLDDLSAGAFVDVGDRFRFRGELRFSSPDDDLFLPSEQDEREPEIKFESALRF